MSLSKTEQFAAAAAGPSKPKTRQRPAPFPIRLSPDERSYLESKAGNRPLGTYIRSELLGDAEAPRKAARKPPIDSALLGRILGLLGQADQVKVLFMLLAAAESERISMAEKERTALQEACADVREMRTVLIKALGLRS
tara:strand:+ start:723 stop:1139 length:417 start_codon:yes stop_codon:yes gene_type:complete